MPTPTVEIKLEDVLAKIDNRLERIEGELTDIKVSQAEIRDEIKTLDEKVTGIGKRLENQEFIGRGILTALIVALLAGVAKYFWFMPNP